MSTRHAILLAVLTRVSAIEVANGYATDAGLTIRFGESAELGPDDPDAAVAIVVGDDQVEDEGADILTRLPFEVQALAKADTAQPWLTIEAVLDDLKRAMETVDRTLGGLLTRDLLRGRTRTLRREPGATTVGAARSYTATYVESWGA